MMDRLVYGGNQRPWKLLEIIVVKLKSPGAKLGLSTGKGSWSPGKGGAGPGCD